MPRRAHVTELRHHPGELIIQATYPLPPGRNAIRRTPG